MENAIAKTAVSIKNLSEDTLSALILNGDISRLTQPQRIEYYTGICSRLGLDPATKPFNILVLKGKTVLYADRGCAAQLNNLHDVSHNILKRERLEGNLYAVSGRAFTKDGRETENIGIVNIAGLQGEDLANAMMKAETKCKRRSTLDLVGLGLLDESEVDDIRKTEAAPAAPRRASDPPPATPGPAPAAAEGEFRSVPPAEPQADAKGPGPAAAPPQEPSQPPGPASGPQPTPPLPDEPPPRQDATAAPVDNEAQPSHRPPAPPAGEAGKPQEFEDTVARVNSKEVRGGTRYGICTGSGRWVNTFNSIAWTRAKLLIGTNIRAIFKVQQTQYGLDLLELTEITPGGRK